MCVNKNGEYANEQMMDMLQVKNSICVPYCIRLYNSHEGRDDGVMYYDMELRVYLEGNNNYTSYKASKRYSEILKFYKHEKSKYGSLPTFPPKIIFKNEENMRERYKGIKTCLFYMSHSVPNPYEDNEFSEFFGLEKL